MKSSEQVDVIAPAWVAALQALGKVARDSQGNWGEYVSIAAVDAAVTPVLSENGLAAHQTTTQDDQGRLVVATRVWHTSGQWLENDGLHLTVPADPQKVLGALTYGRRGEAMAFFGLVSGGDAKDDDGQSAASAVDVSDQENAVRDAIKKLDSNARDELAEWVGAQNRAWPVRPRDLHTDPGWCDQLANHLLAQEAT